MKSIHPFFSIVIPAYNAASSIERTLESVRNQTYCNYEVLVTNDGSTDNTEAVISDYLTKFPEFPLKITNQKNKGIGGARNSSLFRAQGHFIAFLDADDIWYHNKLETVALFLLESPKTDVVWHDQCEVSRKGAKRKLSSQEIPGDAYETLVFQGNRLSTSATVVRSEFALAVGGFSENIDFNSAEDYEFWIRLASAGASFAHIPTILGEYHRVEGSITTKIEYHINNVFNVFLHHFALLKETGRYSVRFLNKIYKKRLAASSYTLSFLYYEAGANNLARRALLTAMRRRPLWWKNYALFVWTLLISLKNLLKSTLN